MSPKRNLRRGIRPLRPCQPVTRDQHLSFIKRSVRSSSEKTRTVDGLTSPALMDWRYQCLEAYLRDVLSTLWLSGRAYPLPNRASRVQFNSCKPDQFPQCGLVLPEKAFDCGAVFGSLIRVVGERPALTQGIDLWPKMPRPILHIPFFGIRALAKMR